MRNMSKRTAALLMAAAILTAGAPALPEPRAGCKRGTRARARQRKRRRARLRHLRRLRTRNLRRARLWNLRRSATAEPTQTANVAPAQSATLEPAPGATIEPAQTETGGTRAGRDCGTRAERESQSGGVCGGDSGDGRSYARAVGGAGVVLGRRYEALRRGGRIAVRDAGDHPSDHGRAVCFHGRGGAARARGALCARSRGVPRRRGISDPSVGARPERRGAGGRDLPMDSPRRCRSHAGRGRRTDA